MSSENSPRHTLTRKLPIAAIIIWFFTASFFQTVFGVILRVSGIFSATPKSAEYAGSIIGSIVFLVFMKFWYRPDYSGMLRSSLSAKATLLATAPVILYSLAVLLYQLIRYQFYWDSSLINAIQALAAGVTEETLLRATMIPIAMGFLRSEKRVWLVPLITGLIFGALHLANIFSGATVFNGCFQAFITALVGIYYGVLFTATGSILPGIITHSVYDYICFAGDPTLTGGIMTSAVPVSEIIFNIVIAAGLATAAVYILKKIGTSKILAIWNEKWGRNI